MDFRGWWRREARAYRKRWNGEVVVLHGRDMGKGQGQGTFFYNLAIYWRCSPRLRALLLSETVQVKRTTAVLQDAASIVLESFVVPARQKPFVA